MDRSTMWEHVREQRVALADLLDGLDGPDWERASLCAGWRVRDVAAHLVLGEQVSIPSALAALARARGDFNRMIHDSAVRAAHRPTGEIAADLRAHAASRKVPPGGTVGNVLVDVLVHAQDIAVPLGHAFPMPVAAARAAADVVWSRSFPFRARRRLAGHRLVADDTDWTAGEGDEVRGPISALLLLCTGRPAALPGFATPPS